MNAASAARNHPPTSADRLRLKRRHACWLGVICATPSTFGSRLWTSSLILDPGIEPRVEKVHDEVQAEQYHRIQQHKAHGHGVIAVVETVDEKHAESGQLKNAFHNKRAGQQI